MMSNGRGMCRDTSNRRRFSRSALLGALIICATGAAEAADSGPYLGADLGWGFTSGSVDWRTAPDIALHGPALSEQDLAGSFFAGYRFNRFFGVEAGYVDLGHFSSSLTGRSNSPDAHADTTTSARGGTVAAVGTFPFGNWEAYLKSGVLFANTHITVSGSNDTVSIDDRVSTETAHALAGVGLGYNVDAHWRAQIGITEYFRVGSNVGTNDRINGPNIRALTAGVTYRFQGGR
jgi:hypothetical protein